MESDGFGTSSTSSSSAAFQETFSSTSGVTNQSNNSAPDEINHNNDLFLIWLNPQIIAFGSDSGQGPVGYSVGVQPLADGTAPSPDIIEVFASAMEANSAGMTSVPSSELNPIPTLSGALVPGLASICKSVITAEYNAGQCTQEDQCGCTPADFLPILENDPLLFYYGSTGPLAPYPSTASPLTANVSDESICGTLPIAAGSDCRYVPVPETAGSTQPTALTLKGPEMPNGNVPSNSFQQGENTQTTTTLGGQNSTTVSQTWSINLNILTGCIDYPFLNLGSCGDKGGTKGSGTGQWGVTDTMSWTDMQSLGTASGSGVSLFVSLGSSTQDCSQPGNIGLFEDTIFHTFVFQQPPNFSSPCTTLSPSFSVTAVPSGPSQTGLSLGHSTSYTVAVAAWNGFSGTVALSVSGLPAGVTASLSAGSVTTSSVASAVLTLTAAYSSSTYIGDSSVTVTGTSGSLANSAIIPLTTRPLQYAGYCGVQ